MRNIINTKFFLFFFLILNLNAQLESSIDTIYNIRPGETVQLKNKFLVDTSIVIINNDNLIKLKNIDASKGRIVIPDSIEFNRIIISYDYLKYVIPHKIGPLWKKLPEVSNDKTVNSNSNQPEYRNKEINPKNSTFTPSGTFYRQLSVTPFGGSDFSGGMQLELNGKVVEANGIPPSS